MKSMILSSGTWIVLMCFSFWSFADVKQNALCYSQLTQNGQLSKIEGKKNLDQKYELASTSKVVTTLWALAKFGPHYRFPTRLYIMNRDGEKADIHIEGSRDPMFGREMMYLLTSELNKLGIKQVSKLTFDENFKLFWTIRDFESGIAHARSMIFHPLFVRRTLRSLAQKNFIENIYASVRAQAKAVGLSMLPTAKLNYESIDYLPSQTFHDAILSRVHPDDLNLMVLRSVPLYEQLKQMNLVSHNTLADHLFIATSEVDMTERKEVNLESQEEIDWDRVNDRYTSRLKTNASAKFHKFISENYELKSDDIEFVNGSGDSEYGEKSKLYNKASCKAMLVILEGAKNILKEYSMDLYHVMAVSGVEKSTLGSRYAAYNKSVIAKTGTVNPAITLAGELSTKSGEILFTVFQHTDGPKDAGEARNEIREEIGQLMVKFKNSKPVNYTPMRLYPFDQRSALKKVSERTLEQIQRLSDLSKVDDIISESFKNGDTTQKLADRS